MNRFLVLAALALPIMAAPIVTYSTLGSFTPPGGPVITLGGGTLAYLTGGGFVDLADNNPSNATFGVLDASGFTSLSSLAGYTFTLTINQTTPVPASGSLTGTLSGSVVLNGSSAFLKFAAPTLVLGPVTYQIDQAQVGDTVLGIPIVAPSTHPGGTVSGGTTTIQGTIGALVPPSDVADTPEPGTIGLIGLGLSAIGLIGRRRFRAL